MRELYCIILLGSLGTVFLQLFPLRGRAKAAALLIFSLLSATYVAGIVATAGMACWLLGVYALSLAMRGFASRMRWGLLAGYAGSVTAVFLSFKLGAWHTPERNLLAGGFVPLGFSFLMFFSIAFLVEVADGELTSPSPLTFAFGALYFPTYIAGPYARYREHAAELARAPEPSEVFRGYCIFCQGAFRFGLSQSLLRPRLLDKIPLEGGRAFGLHPVAILLLASAYLYLNFSGFSDMLVGLSSMMGIRLTRNFRFPFLTESMAEYWRKWHITLGAWFRDYVFFPLNQGLRSRLPARADGALLTAASVFATFFLLGAWHGLSGKFFAWAAANAALVAFVPPPTRWRAVNLALNLVAILLINALFLSKDLGTFASLVASLLPGRSALGAHDLHAAAIAVTLLAIAWALEAAVARLDDSPGKRIVWLNFALCLGSLSAGLIFGMSKTDFAYLGF